MRLHFSNDLSASLTKNKLKEDDVYEVQDRSTNILWCQRLFSGDLSIENRPNTGQPMRAIDERQVAKVKDRRLLLR